MREMNSSAGPLSLCVRVALLFQLITSERASALRVWLRSTSAVESWWVLVFTAEVGRGGRCVGECVKADHQGKFHDAHVSWTSEVSIQDG